MKIIKCKNDGHLFNRERYKKCPVCGTPWDTEYEQETDKAVVSAPVKEAAPQKKGEIKKYDPIIKDIKIDNELHSLTGEEYEQKKRVDSTEIDMKDKAEVKKTSNKIEPVRTIALSFKDDLPIALLVAVEGLHRGEIFKVYEGQNTVGRSDDMMVRLGNDMTVSRNVHCMVVCDENTDLYIRPGQSRGMTYLNSEVLFKEQNAKDRDILSIGKTKLMIIKICDKNFRWEKE